MATNISIKPSNKSAIQAPKKTIYLSPKIAATKAFQPDIKREIRIEDREANSKKYPCRSSQGRTNGERHGGNGVYRHSHQGYDHIIKGHCPHGDAIIWCVEQTNDAGETSALSVTATIMIFLLVTKTPPILYVLYFINTPKLYSFGGQHGQVPRRFDHPVNQPGDGRRSPRRSSSKGLYPNLSTSMADKGSQKH